MQTTLTLTWALTQLVFWVDLMALTIIAAALPVIAPPFLLFTHLTPTNNPLISRPDPRENPSAVGKPRGPWIRSG